jgi:hypothetical protein
VTAAVVTTTGLDQAAADSSTSSAAISTIADAATYHAISSPGLILAHCGVGAFEQVIPRVGEFENLYFDTSWGTPADVWALVLSGAAEQNPECERHPLPQPAEGMLLTRPSRGWPVIRTTRCRG